ncbi:Protoporphyrinogen oxidase [Xylaria venustula]|nr:Protoporphyrinogen oxidase [Xylaria venustula]
MISQRPEDVLINLLRSVYHNAHHAGLRLTGRPTSLFKPRSTRHLNTWSRPRSTLWSPIGRPADNGSPGIAACQGQKQTYGTTPNDATKPREIAVLGAGITGLTAAHYLARHAENAHITIYEASDGPGGWVKAKRVEVEDEAGRRGHVLLQHGPRMLRSSSTSNKYDDLVLYDVLASLNMADQIRHPEAVSNHRYIYYPDHLVKMPSAELSLDNIVGAIQSYLTEPIWSGGLGAAYNAWVSYNKTLDPSQQYPASRFKDHSEDESVAQFLTRLTNDDRIVNNVVSGMMHGIYGGDIDKLSARHTVFERLWCHFQNPLPSHLGWVNVKEWYLLNDLLSGPNRLKIIELAESAVDWKLLAFEDGLVSLVQGLEKDLKNKDNVTFKYEEPVTSLKHENGKILVTTPRTEQPVQYDHVICTLFSKQLARITEPRDSLPSLAETHAVTIMAVNLWYPNPNLLAEGGFGYLIPSSTPNNHEGALGVLFDSDLRTGDSEMPGTKLTVMLGGHHWDGWEHFPSEELGISMAKEVVRRQLGISENEKVVAAARLCRECLPQHFVGHRDRMGKAHYELLSAFQGHLTVAGPSYTTIGVIPAMRAGFDAGMRVARNHEQPWFRIPEHTRGDQNNKSTEYDYWDGFWSQADPEDLLEFEDDADVIGVTGLTQFTGQELDYMRGCPHDALLFRRTTGHSRRFRSADGQFIDVDQRRLKNAPPFYETTQSPKNDE